MDRLSRTEQVICGSAVALFLASFLPWFRVRFLGALVVTRIGWQTGVLWCGLPVLLSMLMLAHIVIARWQIKVELPDLPWPRVHLVCGVLSGALVLLKIVLGHHESGVGFERAGGLLLAAVAAIGLVYGGLTYYREHERDAF